MTLSLFDRPRALAERDSLAPFTVQYLFPGWRNLAWDNLPERRLPDTRFDTLTFADRPYCVKCGWLRARFDDPDAPDWLHLNSCYRKGKPLELMQPGKRFCLSEFEKLYSLERKSRGVAVVEVGKSPWVAADADRARSRLATAGRVHFHTLVYLPTGTDRKRHDERLAHWNSRNGWSRCRTLKRTNMTAGAEAVSTYMAKLSALHNTRPDRILQLYGARSGWLAA